jgi:hypothetical protein
MDFLCHLDLVCMIFTDSYIGACHLGKMDFLCHLAKMARVVKMAPHLLHKCPLGNFRWRARFLGWPGKYVFVPARAKQLPVRATSQITSYSQPTHTALQQSQRTTEMTMTVGIRRHGVVVAAPDCQGRPSTSPCYRRRRPARRRVYRRPPERRPRHCGGRDGGAGAMGPPPDEGGAGGSSTRRVGPGGRPRRMPVHESAMGD